MYERWIRYQVHQELKSITNCVSFLEDVQPFWLLHLAIITACILRHVILGQLPLIRVVMQMVDLFISLVVYTLMVLFFLHAYTQQTCK